MTRNYLPERLESVANQQSRRITEFCVLAGRGEHDPRHGQSLFMKLPGRSQDQGEQTAIRSFDFLPPNRAMP